MVCMFPLDENIHLCGVDTKIVTHSGRRSQLLLSATRCGHPSSYIGSSVDPALVCLSMGRSLLSSQVSDVTPDNVRHFDVFVRVIHP